MSYAEHLIENALIALKESKDLESAWKKFSENRLNIDMSDATSVKLDYVWDMAVYVHFNHYVL